MFAVIGITISVDNVRLNCGVTIMEARTLWFSHVQALSTMKFLHSLPKTGVLSRISTGKEFLAENEMR